MTGSESDDRYARGLEARKRVVGPEYVEKQLAAAGELDRDFQRMVTEYCWGEVWTGTALSDKQRSLQNLCLLAALNRPTEFETHCRGALRNGVTVDELRETLTQIAVYAGIPAGHGGVPHRTPRARRARRTVRLTDRLRSGSPRERVARAFFPSARIRAQEGQ